VPIKALNPYLARWTIKARCSQKGEVRRSELLLAAPLATPSLPCQLLLALGGALFSRLQL